MRKTVIVFIFLLASALYTHAQLLVDTTATAAQLAQKLVGNGVTIANPVLNCSPSASAKFSNGGSTQIGIPDGIMLTNGTAVQIDSPYSFLASTDLTLPGDNDLDVLLYNIGSLDTMTFDACVLEFDVNPLGDTLSFKYVFASEEYEDFTCSDYTDVFAFFISGPNPAGGNYVDQNIALIPGTTLPVAINTVNCGAATGGNINSGCISTSYSQYYVWDSTICYSGSTIPLIASAAVQPCHTYHLKLAISDVGDGNLDSGVFIEGGSLSSNGLPTIKTVAIDGNLNYAVRNCADVTITLVQQPAPTVASTVHLILGGSAINGTDYSQVPDSVIFAANDSLAAITIDPLNYPGAMSGKTVTIYLLSNICGSAAYDSVTITIQDSITLQTGPAQSTCLGGSVTLSATGVGSCHWTPGATLSDSTILDPVATPMVSTTYFATTTVGACTASDSTRITISSVSDGGPDDTICINGTATLAASGAGTWTIIPGNPVSTTITSPASAGTTVTGFTTTGVYRYLWTVGSSCADTVDVLVKTGPVVTVDNTAFCIGDSGTLTATSTVPGGTYTWSPGGATTASITVTPTASTQYTVTYVVAGCPSATATATVGANVAPTGTLAVMDPSCADTTGGSIVSTLNPAGIYTYHWSNHDSTAAISHLPMGSYTVTATDAHGCTVTLSATLAYTVGHLAILPSDTTVFEGDTIQLNSYFSGFPSDSIKGYTWTPAGGLSCSICANPLILTGNYADSINVDTLVVHYNAGCEVAAYDTFEVHYLSILAMPNAFSPNGDSRNDTFLILAKGVSEFTMHIYNRWGQEVFTSANVTSGWDGTYKGKQQPSGEYKYFFTIRYQNGKSENHTGTLSLFR